MISVLRLTLFTLSLLFCFFYSFNASGGPILCPTLEEIRLGHLHGWLPLYREGEELASDKDVEQFKQALQNFDYARWNKDYLESAHCFYQGSDPILEKITLAHDAWRPEKNENWKWLQPESLAECVSFDVSLCGFIS